MICSVIHLHIKLQQHIFHFVDGWWRQTQFLHLTVTRPTAGRRTITRLAWLGASTVVGNCSTTRTGPMAWCGVATEWAPTWRRVITVRMTSMFSVSASRWRALRRSTTIHHCTFCSPLCFPLCLFSSCTSSPVTVGCTTNPQLDLFVYVVHCGFCS